MFLSELKLWNFRKYGDAAYFLFMVLLRQRLASIGFMCPSFLFLIDFSLK